MDFFVHKRNRMKDFITGKTRVKSALLKTYGRAFTCVEIIEYLLTQEIHSVDTGPLSIQFLYRVFILLNQLVLFEYILIVYHHFVKRMQFHEYGMEDEK